MGAEVCRKEMRRKLAVTRNRQKARPRAGFLFPADAGSKPRSWHEARASRRPESTRETGGLKRAA